MLLIKYAGPARGFPFARAPEPKSAAGKSGHSYVALACVLGLSALALAPLTPVGRSAGEMIAAAVDLRFLQDGRQQLAGAAAGLFGAGGSDEPARSGQANSAPSHGLNLDSVRMALAEIKTPTIGLSAPVSVELPVESRPPSDKDAISVPQFFRRIARFGLSNEVDFAPTAATGSLTSERLPPLAHLKTPSPTVRNQIAAAAKLRKSRGAKPEFSATPFIPGELFSGPAMLRSVQEIDIARPRATGKRAGRV